MPLKYAFNPKMEVSAKAYGSSFRISTKNSVNVCKAISGLSLKRGKNLLVRILTEKESLDGKYHTNSAKEILELLMSAESNAEFKGLDLDRLIIFASAHKGFKFYRPRRFKMRGDKRKVSNIQIVLVQK